MRCATLAAIILLSLAQQVYGQDAKVLFHVTSVSQAEATDWCTTGKCSATRFTVEGYTQDKDGGVQYVLECVETIANEPTPHLTMQCVRVHAHSDYSVKIDADYVTFGDVPSTRQGEPYIVSYNIKSEKESRKK
jgi:hypothetical protein